MMMIEPFKVGDIAINKSRWGANRAVISHVDESHGLYSLILLGGDEAGRTLAVPEKDLIHTGETMDLSWLSE